MDMVVARFEVWLVALDPVQGSEIAKTRPCLVISPDELNSIINTVLVAPMTSTRKFYPSRVNCKFGGQSGQIALDQTRAVDKARLVKRLGTLNKTVCQTVCQTLVTLFVY